MKLPKIRNGAEVRMVPRCQYSKSDVLHQSLLDPARRNSHRLGSWSSSADDRKAGPALPLHTGTRSLKGPTGPPRRTRNRPGGYPATTHAGSGVGVNPVPEGRFGMFLS